MKKILLTLFTFALIVQFGFSQINYSFELDSATYVPIEEDFEVISGFDEIWWGTEHWTDIPIGFSFRFLNQEFTKFDLFVSELYFSYDSLVFFPYHAELMGEYPLFLNPDSTEYRFPPIIYKTIGEVGNRVCILEYKDAQFADDPLLTWFTYFTNYQVRLYEGSNILEVHYGPEYTSDTVFVDVNNGPGPLIGLANFESNEMLVLRGDPQNPETYTEETLDTNFTTLFRAPQEGLIYRFLPNTVGTNDIIEDMLTLRIVPNPASDYINTILPESTEVKSMQITNALGQVVYQSNSMQKRIDVANFLPGMYYLKVMDEKGQIGVASFIK